MPPPPTNRAASDAAARRAIRECPVCCSARLHYAFSKDSYRVVRCDGCRLMLLNPQPSDQELLEIRSAGYFIGQSECADDRTASIKAETAKTCLEQINEYRGTAGGRLLEVGCGRGELLVEAEAMGYDVTGVETSSAASQQARRRLRSGTIFCGQLEAGSFTPASFDVCVLSGVLQQARNPIELLRTIHRLLKPGGALLIATPSLDSWSAKLLRQNWAEFKPEHLTYFDSNTLQNALFRAGFEQVAVRPGYKKVGLDYIANHFSRFSVPLFSRLVNAAARSAPRFVRKMNVKIVASGVQVLASAAPVAAQRKLSVIVPAFNEAATLAQMMDGLLQKTLPEMEIEVILVESNSTDGTREIARQYAEHPQVKLVLEDEPRGKGHAVRTGFAHATGDFILIQDADLEYDFEDYDALLEPLVQGREAFVLGSRHGGNTWWKMRQFTNQPLLSLMFNSAHKFFTGLVNVLFRQKLKDPFTMYKVFRRDCLFGLNFTCNRFDFDYELLIKLVRKGYTPVEIPVNYRCRTYAQGKKVAIFRDPLTWIWACLRLRMSRNTITVRLRQAPAVAAGNDQRATQHPLQAAA